ncbi:hypothetical protein EGW08_001775 [Elysia chlorotica]|uniref:Ig-like domain-containing protein n=1 Tax=Elysia chlorotica TaxID=188477 RepID=A0A3S1I1K8_ELYCH|nr:hypothetical protein EGW08_001775 [Elysia chlorotica]
MVYISFASDGGPLCFDCPRLRNPYACTTIKRCPKGFKCFSKYYWEPQSQNLYWDQGCLSDSFCSALPSQRAQALSSPVNFSATAELRTPVSRVRRLEGLDDDALRFCISCCKDYSDYCNMLPCDHTLSSGPGQVPSGLTCLSCTDVSDPANCTNAQRCAANQNCAVWTQANGKFGMGCKDDTLCQADGDYITFGKRNTDVAAARVGVVSGTGCRACCKDNFCNSLYCSAINDLPTGIFTVATTPTTTTTPLTTSTTTPLTTTTTTPMTTSSTIPTTTTPATPLSVTLQPKQMTVQIGSNVSFNCRVQGQPPLNALFTITDSQNSTTTLPMCVKSITTVQEDVICEILTSQRPHGLYQVQCIANSNQGSAMESVVLDVKEITVPLSVDIHPSDITLFSGMPANVYCRVDGSPTVSYIWIDSSTGQDITNSSNFRTYVTANNTAVLEIAPQAPNTQAVFVCQAYNRLDSLYLPFNVNSFINVSITQSPQDITLTDVIENMSCDFESWPPANVSWFFLTNTNLVIPANESQIYNNHTGPIVTSILNISPELVKQLDIKSASCEADNGFATKSASANVQLLVPAKILTPARSYTVQAGSSFSLRCEAEGSPLPQMAWTFTDEFGINKILIGANVEKIGAVQSLKIDHIYDSGTFTCYAKNDLATVTAAFQVIVS